MLVCCGFTFLKMSAELETKDYSQEGDDFVEVPQT